MRNQCLQILFLAFLSLNNLWPASSSFLADNTIAQIVERTSDSVVHITAKVNVKTYSARRMPGGLGGLFDFFFKVPNNVMPRESGIGTGFIYDESGLILTNHHVIQEADQVSVTLKNGKVYNARYLGGDPSRDLAVLQIDDEDFSGKFPASYVAQFGDSSKLKVGEWVIAIGSPFKLDHTVTLGIVSAKGRSLNISSETAYNNLIQTDASINPGNSGGPLLDLQGRVIGINTAINPMGQGLGFAIPINLANRIVKDLAKYGEVKRSWLGVYIEDLTPEMAKSMGMKLAKGVLVGDVIDGTPASKAGLKAGDVILKVNGSLTPNREVLVGKIQEVPIGEYANLQVIRNNEWLDLKVQLSERGSHSTKKLSNLRRPGNSLSLTQTGMRVSDLTPRLRRGLGLSQRVEGVFVARVSRGSFAFAVGLAEGDVIVQVGENRTPDVASLRDLDWADHSGSVVLILREGYLQYLDIP